MQVGCNADALQCVGCAWVVRGCARVVRDLQCALSEKPVRCVASLTWGSAARLVSGMSELPARVGFMPCTSAHTMARRLLGDMLALSMLSNLKGSAKTKERQMMSRITLSLLDVTTYLYHIRMPDNCALDKSVNSGSHV